MKDNVHENEYVKGWSEGKIMFAEFKASEMDLTAARESVKARMNAAKGKNFYFLIDARKLKSVTKEARDYFGSEEGSQQVLASALVIDSMVSKVIGNFFLQINKPKVPFRIFTNTKEAVNWLNSLSSK